VEPWPFPLEFSSARTKSSRLSGRRHRFSYRSLGRLQARSSKYCHHLRHLRGKQRFFSSPWSTLPAIRS